METEEGDCGDGSSVTAAKRRSDREDDGTVPLSPFYSIAPKLYYMKILLLGKNGQVGFELQRTLAPLGEVTALGRQELDLSEPDSIRSIVRSAKPGLIVNAAAYTAVDKAESEPDLAMAVNGTAPGILAEEAALLKATLIHYSTDYVFDGSKKTPYTEKDKPNPISTYGKTKLAGEEAIIDTECDHLILRTGWVYGLRGSNFLLTMQRLFKEREELQIVSDQYGSPTWARMIAEATTLLVMQRACKTNHKSRLYHLSASGKTSWYGFAEAIYEQSLVEGNNSCALKPVTTEQYQTKAARPRNSVLSNQKLKQETGLALPAWRSSLTMAINGKS